MKIIGKTGSSGFIVTAGMEELCQVMGFHSSYGMKDSEKPDVGRDIKVSDLYQALSVSRERREEIAKLANQLRTVAGRVDSINQALASPIVEVEVKS